MSASSSPTFRGLDLLFHRIRLVSLVAALTAIALIATTSMALHAASLAGVAIAVVVSQSRDWAGVGLIFIGVAALVAIAGAAARAALDAPWVLALPIGGLAVAMLGMLARRIRSPFSHRIEGAVRIAAPAADVWETIWLDPSKECWDASIARVAPIDGRDDMVVLFYAPPLEDERLVVALYDVRPGESYVLRSLAPGAGDWRTDGQPIDTSPDFADAAREAQGYRVEPVGDAAVILRTVSIIERPDLATLTAAWALNPPLDQARRIKAHLEGVEDRSVFVSLSGLDN